MLLMAFDLFARMSCFSLCHCF